MGVPDGRATRFVKVTSVSGGIPDKCPPRKIGHLVSFGLFWIILSRGLYESWKKILCIDLLILDTGSSKS